MSDERASGVGRALKGERSHAHVLLRALSGAGAANGAVSTAAMRPVRAAAAPILSRDGTILGAVAVITDMTRLRTAAAERKRLLHELEVERARLAYVFREAPAFLAVFRGPTHVFELVNAQQEIERLLVESEQALLDAEVARTEAETARIEVQAANGSKGEFLAVMSHELRTPLTAIGGCVELIELGIRGPVTPQQREDLARIQRSQRHLLGLIKGVLNYLRAEAGAVHYDVGDVPLDAVLSTCETLIAPQARAKRIALEFTVCNEPLTVRADREKLQQIVVNVLSNAVTFTAHEGVVILACGREGSRERESNVIVTVTDTGRGIAADALERIFEPFVQVDTRLTRTEEGMGLGLAISRDLARGMGGDLTVESTFGVGSTFTLTVPAAM